MIRSFLQLLDRPVPMVATDDVGRVAAELLLEDWKGSRIVALEGPARVTPDQMADAFAQALGTPVRAHAVPRGEWEDVFRRQGMTNPQLRAGMIDGFNQGWIEFEHGSAGSRKGTITPDIVVEAIVRKARGAISAAGFSPQTPK